MVDDNGGRSALSFGRSSGLEEGGVHVLTMKHIVDVAPFLLVVIEVVLIEDPTGIPVAHNEFHLKFRTITLTVTAEEGIFTRTTGFMSAISTSHSRSH